MSTVEQIETQIKNLSLTELAELRQWFIAFDADAWDAQIEEDYEDVTFAEERANVR